MRYPWTAADIPSQTGRRAIVTGANSGIGFVTALELARHGAAVVIASRDPAKGRDAVARIRAELPSADLAVAELDLASLASVRRFAESELARGLPLDLLINNAGIYSPPTRLETADHFELQFGTNVLGHFALTALLFPALLRSAENRVQNAPRVVTVSSIAHKRAQIQFADLQAHGRYSPMQTYGQSKLADLILALELARRLTRRGIHMLSTAAHPGVSGTNLFQVAHFPSWQRPLRRLSAPLINALLNSVAAGALPTLFAATAPEAPPATPPGVHNGGYYGPQGLGEMRGGDVGPATIAPQANDPASAAKLWRICEDLTGTALLSG